MDSVKFNPWHDPAAAFFFFAIFCILNCGALAYGNALRYVAIGDSYTQGTAVDPEKAWPSQLVRRLNEAGLQVELTANLARGGWTSQQVIDFQLPQLNSLKPDFITLQIGVNDWIQGVPPQEFSRRLDVLLNEIQSLHPEPARLLIVTIPDFSCSPTGARWGYGKSAVNGITRFNQTLETKAGARGWPAAEIHSLSQELCKKPGMFASDGLHPSGKQYGLWLEKIVPEAIKILQAKNQKNLN